MIANFNFKWNNFYTRAFIIMGVAAFMFLVLPDISFASTGTVKTKLNNGTKAIQGVITGLIVVVGILGSSKIVVKHLPSIDNPQVKNEMWGGIGQVALGVIGGAALVWIIPWLWSLFK